MPGIQEVQNVRFPFSYWANKLDWRDYKCAGPPTSELTNYTGILLGAGAWLYDIIYNYCTATVVNDIGFVIGINLSSDGNNANLRFLCNGEFLGVPGMNGGAEYYEIFHPRPHINVFNAGAGNMYPGFTFYYISNSKMKADIDGEENPADVPIRGARVAPRPVTTKDKL